jgi:hypothetical protein
VSSESLFDIPPLRRRRRPFLQRISDDLIDPLNNPPRYPRIIAYTYEADMHCPTCARERFGLSGGVRTNDTDPMLDYRGVRTDAVDREGNPVTPVFADADWCGEQYLSHSLECADCQYVMASHSPSFHGFCNCEDGCETGECDACGDFREHDEPERYDGCSCVNCEAAAAYTPIRATDPIELMQAPVITPEALATYLAEFAEAVDA